jgi:hypothetical protein
MESEKSKTPNNLKIKATNSINLIPEITEKEKVKVEKKESINLSSAVFIFFIMLFTVGILLSNFLLRNEVNQAEASATNLSFQIRNLKDTELKAKNVNSKYTSIKDLKEEDLQYFYITESANTFPTSIKVKSISLNERGEFTMSGLATNEGEFDKFILTLEKDEEYQDVVIGQMQNLTPEALVDAAQYNESNYKTNWSVTGRYHKELSSSEIIEDLAE